ncbi:hypothetical protein SAMN02745176_01840 [Lutispora thermophila DSM 19022]|uniref:Uncharacterized protein n=1 Tax=Lutispora thermophila DSM 19022 TaxID=1122184 RepID=A0A1M6F641_9FIRM|nr:hypothetical protein SAMN02745176_01840 [Lutispora thermophila DSM 19022]
MIKIFTNKSFYFIGKFSDLIYILNDIAKKNASLKEYLTRENV